MYIVVLNWCCLLILISFFLLPVQKGSLWSVLEKLRDKGSSMSESRILNILHGVCEGLKAIHDKGYAHRYLNPK